MYKLLRILALILLALLLIVPAPYGHAQDFNPPSGNPPPHYSDTSQHDQFFDDYAPYLGQRFKRVANNVEKLFATFMRTRHKRGEAYRLAWAFVNNVLVFLGNKPENQGDNFKESSRTLLITALPLDANRFFPRFSQHPWLSPLKNNAREIAMALLIIGFSVLALYWIASLAGSNLIWRSDMVNGTLTAVATAFVALNGVTVVDLLQDMSNTLLEQMCNTIAPNYNPCNPAASLHYALFDLDPQSPVAIRLMNGFLAYALILLFVIFYFAQEVAIFVTLLFSIPAIAAFAIPFFGQNITMVWVRMQFRYILVGFILFGLYLLFSIAIAKLIQNAAAFSNWRDLLKFIFWMLAGGFIIGYSYITFDAFLKPIIEETIAAVPMVIEGLQETATHIASLFSGVAPSTAIAGAGAGIGALTISQQLIPSNTEIDETVVVQNYVIVQENSEEVPAQQISQAQPAQSQSDPSSLPAFSPFLAFSAPDEAFYYTPNHRLAIAIQYAHPAFPIWILAWASAVHAVGGTLEDIENTSGEPFLETMTRTLEQDAALYLNQNGNAENSTLPFKSNYEWKDSLLLSLTELSSGSQQGFYDPMTAAQADAQAFVLVQNATTETLLNAIRHVTAANTDYTLADLSRWSTAVLAKTISTDSWQKGIQLHIGSETEIEIGKWQTLAGSVIAQHLLAHDNANYGGAEAERTLLEQMSVLSASLLKANLSTEFLSSLLSEKPTEFWSAGTQLAQALLDAEQGVNDTNIAHQAIAHLLTNNIPSDSGAMHTLWNADALIVAIAQDERKAQNYLVELIENDKGKDDKNTIATTKDVIAALLTASYHLPSSAYREVRKKVEDSFLEEDVRWIKEQLRSDLPSQIITENIREHYRYLFEELIRAYGERNAKTPLLESGNKEKLESGNKEKPEEDQTLKIISAILISIPTQHRTMTSNGEWSQVDTPRPLPTQEVRRSRFSKIVANSSV